MDRFMEANRDLWDELTPIHARSAFYDVEAFKAGQSRLLSIEREAVGDVRGKSLLHLQCHFGLDTLSWARLGARATGVDFSAPAIRLARSLNEELGLGATFVHSNVYDLPDALTGQFDLVYTSYGVLVWLPDLTRWAAVVAHFLEPGGAFYIVEGHPFMYVFDMERAAEPQGLRVDQSYFGGAEPRRWEAEGSYADREAPVAHPSYEWSHGLGEIVSAIAGAGLVVDYPHEFPVCSWQAFPFMERGDDGWWRLPAGHPEIPLTFSLKAHRPE